jgi:predicted ATPase
MLVPAADGVDTIVTPGGLVRLNLVENGKTYSSQVISDGTLRVLGMLAMLAPGGPSTTIGFEEPENGVHPRRLQIVARLLNNAARQSGKQLVVTTHSSKLPDYLKHLNYTQPDSKGDVLLMGGQKEEGQSKFEPIDYSLLFGEQDSERALSEALERGDLGG